ncbi:MAG: type II toxin-antitoxin system HipA family toxin [Oligoflexus sp.]|nr:type II toxin-antitoxin system HipA family toxin [Oligoflexus sp.]
MAKPNKSFKIMIWGETVGYLAPLGSGGLAFQYETSFKNRGWELSPIEMPLMTTTVYQAQSSSSTFQNLPGILADCLPDQYGRSVINGFYKRNFNLEPHSIGALEILSYIGNRSIGALEFLPSSKISEQVDDFLEIQSLLVAARLTMEGNAETIAASLMRVSASAGGRQAKALVDYNPKTQKIRSGFFDKRKGFVPALIKFDGVLDGVEGNCYGRLEYTYSELARLSDISMPKTYLLETENEMGPLAHFIVERFDRNNSKEKLFHYGSLCGLLIRDFRRKHSCTYEEYFRLTLTITQSHLQLEEAFRRCLFNLVFRNQDDHTKNFGFVMDQAGVWTLSPAFDLMYVYGQGVASTHQMTFAGKDDHFEKNDILKVAKQFGIRQAVVTAMFESLSAAIGRFSELAEENGLEPDFTAGVEKRFRREVMA